MHCFSKTIEPVKRFDIPVLGTTVDHIHVCVNLLSIASLRKAPCFHFNWIMYEKVHLNEMAFYLIYSSQNLTNAY